MAFGIHSERVVTPSGVGAGTVVIDGDRIVALVPDGGLGPVPAPDLSQVDVEHVSGAILPGLIDTHVHVNEPGRTDWEGWVSASAAAAGGGITMLVDMPLNSSPVTTTAEAFAAKRAAAAASSCVDFGLWGGLVPGMGQEQVAALAVAGVLGFKCFLAPSGIAEFVHVGRTDLERAMPWIAETGLPLLAHAELVPAEPPAWVGSDRSYAAWAATRPPSFEHEAVELLVELAERTGCRVHVVHVSSAASVELIRRSELVTWETCPHYLCLTDEDIADGDTSAKCAPPLRSRAEVEALWEEVFAHGPAIVSDHSPAPPTTKALETGSIRAAWGGISSLGLQLPLLASELWRRGVDRNGLLVALSTMLAARPAELAGAAHERGAIVVGARADLAIVDLDAEWTVHGADAGWRWPLTPYEGREVRCRVVRTLVGGVTVHGRGDDVEVRGAFVSARSNTPPQMP